MIRPHQTNLPAKYFNPDFWLHSFIAKFEMKVKTCANGPKSYIFNVDTRFFKCSNT
jgi:hypothetical protein